MVLDFVFDHHVTHRYLKICELFHALLILLFGKLDPRAEVIEFVKGISCILFDRILYFGKNDAILHDILLNSYNGPIVNIKGWHQARDVLIEVITFGVLVYEVQLNQ